MNISYRQVSNASYHRNRQMVQKAWMRQQTAKKEKKALLLLYSPKQYNITILQKNTK